mmetsp:Transcript_1651/g.2611  ORF Transcript_1651/g.2611 Transcript_1651/m.2611 type:complete len:312 (+) Transcript_1651:67-1002(+)
MRTSIHSPYADCDSPIAAAKRPHSCITEKEKSFASPTQRIRTLISAEFDDIEENDDPTSLFSPSLSQPDIFIACQETLEAEQCVEEEDASDDDSETFDPYLFMFTLPPHSTVAIQGKLCLSPPTNYHQKSLVLDLDETLVHCTVEPIPNPDFIFPVTFNSVCYQVYARKRPFVDYFLESVSKEFEVIIFTASQQVYADKLLDLLDPENKYFSSRLFREACLDVSGNFIKDLSVLNRDLSKTVLVDNSPYAYGYQIDNGIPIESWFDDDEDTELLKLVGFLRQLHSAPDVRKLLRDRFKTFKLVEMAGSVHF